MFPRARLTLFLSCFLLGGLGPSARSAAPEPAAKGPFLDAVSVPWKVNEFAIARWKTLVGGGEGGQIDQADVQFGLWELAPRAIYQGHRHEVPEIYYVLSGRAEWRVGDEVRVVTAGTTIYARPGAVHRMVNLGDEPVRTVWFWWAPEGRREVFAGPYEFTEAAPEQPEGAGFDEPTARRLH